MMLHQANAISQKLLPGNVEVLTAVAATGPTLAGPHSTTHMLLPSLLPYELPGPAQSHRLPFATPEMELSATHVPTPHTIDVAQCVLDLEAGPASLFVILSDWTLPNPWEDLPQIRSTCSVIHASRRRRPGESHITPPPIVPLRVLPSSSWHSIPKVITLDTSPGSEIRGSPPSVTDLTHLSLGIAQPGAPRICHGGGSPALVKI